jgi:hypothetical protein
MKTNFRRMRRNIPLFPLLPIVPIALFGGLLTLSAITLASVRRLRRQIEPLLEPALPEPAIT